MNEKILSIINSCTTELQLQTCVKWVDAIHGATPFTLTLALDAIDQRREHLQALYNTVHVAD